MLEKHGFEFKNALMQEHFNEHYIESEVFPKGVFKGKLASFSLHKHNVQDSFQRKGSLTLRDIEKSISTKEKGKDRNVLAAIGQS